MTKHLSSTLFFTPLKADRNGKLTAMWANSGGLCFLFLKFYSQNMKIPVKT